MTRRAFEGHGPPYVSNLEAVSEVISYAGWSLESQAVAWISGWLIALLPSLTGLAFVLGHWLSLLGLGMEIAWLIFTVSLEDAPEATLPVAIVFELLYGWAVISHCRWRFGRVKREITVPELGRRRRMLW